MKKYTTFFISLLLIICISLSVAVFYLLNCLNAYPKGEIFFEDPSNCTIVKYELENNFVLLCSYVDQTLVQISVGNTETNAIGESFSKESRG